MEISIHENEKNLLPPADLLGEIEKLQGDLSAERDRYLRMMADFKNYRAALSVTATRLPRKANGECCFPC